MISFYLTKKLTKKLNLKKNRCKKSRLYRGLIHKNENFLKNENYENIPKNGSVDDRLSYSRM